MSRRIRITLSYDGTEYHGWQVQPGLRTIQGTLQAALTQIEGVPVHLDGSGRTDAGVHALAQVAAFTMINPIPVLNLRRAMNRLLPADIRLLDCVETSPDFHPRFDAVAKTYEYRMFRGEICPPFERRYVHHYPYPMNEAGLIEMAPILEGTHDFGSFAAADERDSAERSTVRTIFLSRATREAGRMIYRVRGNGFLKHMVRNMVGTLIECARGNLDSEALRDRLRRASSYRAGPTAPARGLFLVAVEYREPQ
jgi:tRNA pseudouridine38-40 synthase